MVRLYRYMVQGVVSGAAQPQTASADRASIALHWWGTERAEGKVQGSNVREKLHTFFNFLRFRLPPRFHGRGMPHHVARRAEAMDDAFIDFNSSSLELSPPVSLSSASWIASFSERFLFNFLAILDV
jgi:hypothetical protein